MNVLYSDCRTVFFGFPTNSFASHKTFYNIYISADCGIPADLANAIEVFNGTFEGNMVTFVARCGYAFNGSVSVTIMCNELGKWSGLPLNPEGSFGVFCRSISHIKYFLI